MNFREWLNESLALKGKYNGTIFQRLVAAQYVVMPAFQEEAIPGYKDLWKKISRQNDFLQSKFQFNPTNVDPYRSMKDLTKQINKQKQAGIRRPTVNVYAEPPEGPQASILRNDEELPGSGGHPLFSNDQNVILRGVHDVMAHYMGQHPFSARGEYSSYKRHLHTLCNVEQAKSNQCPAAAVLFTEIVGQTSFYSIYGTYAVQKAAIMNDFDHWNVGALSSNSGLNSFFILENKELIPRPDFDYQSFQQSYSVLAKEMKNQLSKSSFIEPLPGE